MASGHSAGAVLHGAFLGRLIANGVNVESINFMAPAIRVDAFRTQVLPHIGTPRARRFAAFVMNDKRELDDVCKAGPVTVYRKSLLYWVSRGFEQPTKGEVPLAGMERFIKKDLPGLTTIVAPADGADDSKCDAKAHGAFDDDVPTMTSVLLRILNKTTASPVNRYEANAAPLPVAVAVAGPRIPVKRQERRRQPRRPGAPPKGRRTPARDARN